MGTATKMTDSGDVEIVDASEHPAVKVKAARAPSLKRPDGLSDSEWAIMKVAKNEDVHKRINDIMSEHATVTADEAAVLLEIVTGAERSAVMEVVKTRRALAPKLATASATVKTLSHIRTVLFSIATDI